MTNTIIAFVLFVLALYVTGRYAHVEDAPEPAQNDEEAVSRPKKRKYTVVRSYRRVVAV